METNMFCSENIKNYYQIELTVAQHIAILKKIFLGLGFACHGRFQAKISFDICSKEVLTMRNRFSHTQSPKSSIIMSFKGFCGEKKERQKVRKKHNNRQNQFWQVLSDAKRCAEFESEVRLA